MKIHFASQVLQLADCFGINFEKSLFFPSIFCSNILLVPFHILLLLREVRNRLFLLSLFQNGGQEIITILFHSFLTCHVVMTYALQQEVLPSGSHFLLSHIAIPKMLYVFCSMNNLVFPTPL